MTGRRRRRGQQLLNGLKDLIGHILRINHLLKHVIEGKKERRIEVTGRRRRRGQQLLNDLKEKRGYRKLKEETLDHTV